MAISAWMRISLMKSFDPIESGSLTLPGEIVVGSIPPVSIMSKDMPLHSASATNRSRVVPGISSVTANRSPARRLNNVLLPTLGRPTKAIIGFGISLSCQVNGIRRMRLFAVFCLGENHGVGVTDGVARTVAVGVGVGATLISTSTVSGSMVCTRT